MRLFCYNSVCVILRLHLETLPSDQRSLGNIILRRLVSARLVCLLDHDSPLQIPSQMILLTYLLLLCLHLLFVIVCSTSGPILSAASSYLRLLILLQLFLSVGIRADHIMIFDLPWRIKLDLPLLDLLEFVTGG